MSPRAYRDWKFSQKIMFVVLITTVLTLAAAFFALLWNDFIIFHKQRQQKLQTLTRVTANNTQAALAFNDANSATATLSALKADPHVVYASLYNHDGLVLADYRATPDRGTLKSLADARAQFGRTKSRAALEGVFLDGDMIGTIFVESDNVEFDDMLRYYFWIACLIFLGATGLAVLLTYGLQKAVSGPVLELTALAKKVSEKKDFSVRAVKKSEDELGILMDNFNGMLGEIQARESTLNNQWQWLQSVLDLMPTPFLFLEIGTGRVTFANKAAMKISGGTFPFELSDVQREGAMYSCYDLQGRLIPRQELPSTRLAQGEKVEGFVIDWLTPSGRKTLIVYGDTLPSLYGHSSVGVINFHDITEIKKTEQALKKLADELTSANADLAHSNKELEEFAYISSHDLQEPLRKIIAFGERLTEDPNQLNEDQKKDFLKRIYNAGYRMKKVIEDLLQYSKISRSEDELLEQVDLNTVMQDIFSDLEMLIAETGARIQVDPLPSVKGNRSQMRHLFQNLVTNSIKFAKKDVPAVIKIENQGIENGCAGVAVRDNGIGFDQKYAGKIFKPFQRLHGKGEYEGTGIGLSIVEKIVQNHRGGIRVESVPGQGSTFYVMLPLDKNKMQASA